MREVSDGALQHPGAGSRRNTGANGREDGSVSDTRELRGGRDFGLLPFLKWGHAGRLHERLLHDVQMWRASLGAQSRATYSDDHRVVTFHASIATMPPTYEWSLTFGDAVHNYRSALDALAWEMANLDDNEPDPRDARHLYFPIKRTRAEFDEQARTRLKSVPKFVLDRMEQLQPHHTEPIEDGIGLIMSDLDNQDKHRSAIEMRAIAADRTHYGIIYRPRDRSLWPDGDDGAEPEWIAPDRVITDGDPILRWTFPHAVDDAEISDLPMRITIERNGKRHDALELLHLIDLQVAETFAMVETDQCRAQWHPKAPSS